MSSAVERIELAPGFTVSRVLTGLWQVADMERDGSLVDPDTAAEAMAEYADAGFTAFDMADHYGSAEVISGIFRRRYPAPVQMLTKWVPKPGPVTRRQVREAVQLALDRMQSERLDLLQFHAWNYADPVWLDCLRWLQECRDDGLIAHLGLTNVDTAHLRVVKSSGIDVISNQVCFSLLDRRARNGMTDFCRRYGVSLLCFGTVAGGFLTEKWLNEPEPAPEQLTSWSLMKYKRYIDTAGGWEVFQDLLRTLDSIARGHGVSMANVACRYILDEPAVGGIIIGARLGEGRHIENNLQLFQFSLAAGDRERLEASLDRLTPIPGDCGDEYRRPPFLTASGDLSHHLESIPKPYEPVTGADGGVRVFSGTPWEHIAGFCRARRYGDRIFISGTTATHFDTLIGGSDPAAQCHFIIDKIEGALQSLGACLADVVRTRVYIKRLEDWESVARAHGERFHGIEPANTMVQAGLIGEGYLVEMEAEAVNRNYKL
ncbi:aldo/keto reductase [bacterium]|nr:aldo/keto reductase [bacterium]